MTTLGNARRCFKRAVAIIIKGGWESTLMGQSLFTIFDSKLSQLNQHEQRVHGNDFLFNRFDNLLKIHLHFDDEGIRDQ